MFKNFEDKNFPKFSIVIFEQEKKEEKNVFIVCLSCYKFERNY